MRLLIFLFVLLEILPTGCSKKKDFSSYVRNKRIIRKATIKNYPDSRYPKTIFGFKSYNVIRKNYLLAIPKNIRAYGLQNGDTVYIVDHIKFGIQSNRYDFYLVKHNDKYVYIDGKCIE